MITDVSDNEALSCECGSMSWSLIKSGSIECSMCGNTIRQGWGEINFNDVSVNGVGHKEPEPMSAFIDVWSIIINNLAVNELINICGSDQYIIKVMLSDCGSMVGLKPILSLNSRRVTQPRKSVSARGIQEAIKSTLGYKYSPKFKLTRYKDMIIFNIKEDLL